MTLNEAVDLRIKELLQERGISCHKMCKDGGIQKSTISQIKKNKSVDTRIIWEICDTLRIAIFDFFNSDLFKQTDYD